MKHLCLTFLGLQLLLFAGKAQISITSASMPGNGDSARYTGAMLNSLGNYTLTGANYTWHFDSLKVLTQGVRDFKSALLTPYAFYFSSPSKYGEKTQDSIGVATFKFKNIYSFYKKTTSVFSAEGIGFSYNNIPLAGLYSNEDELYQFPLNYQDRDSSTFKFKVNLPTVGFYGKQGYRINEVDGWGTIYTPYGNAPCLRLISTQYSTDSIGTPFGNFGFPNVQRSYQWLVTSEKIPFLDITGTLTGNNFTPTQARYRDSARYYNNNPFGLGVNELKSDFITAFYPNPATETVTMVIPQVEGSLTAEIWDLAGKLVRSEHIEGCSEASNKRSMDVRMLDRGIYFLKLKAPGGSQVIKFSKQ